MRRRCRRAIRRPANRAGGATASGCRWGRSRRTRGAGRRAKAQTARPRRLVRRRRTAARTGAGLTFASGPVRSVAAAGTDTWRAPPSKAGRVRRPSTRRARAVRGGCQPAESRASNRASRSTSARVTGRRRPATVGRDRWRGTSRRHARALAAPTEEQPSATGGRALMMAAMTLAWLSPSNAFRPVNIS